jgi:hypothetical protein
VSRFRVHRTASRSARGCAPSPMCSRASDSNIAIERLARHAKTPRPTTQFRAATPGWAGQCPAATATAQSPAESVRCAASSMARIAASSHVTPRTHSQPSVSLRWLSDESACARMVAPHAPAIRPAIPAGSRMLRSAPDNVRAPPRLSAKRSDHQPLAAAQRAQHHTGNKLVILHAVSPLAHGSPWPSIFRSGC